MASAKIQADLNDLSQIAEAVASQLKYPFVVWLEGEMGAGKTTLVAEVLRVMGLPTEVVVNSPTYFYQKEYQIEKHRISHVDLFRLAPGHDLENFLDLDSYDGLFIEWPTKFSEFLPSPSLVVRISNQGEMRTYELSPR